MVWAQEPDQIKPLRVASTRDLHLEIERLQDEIKDLQRVIRVLERRLDSTDV